MCSITGVGERLHRVLGQIRSNSGFHGKKKKRRRKKKKKRKPYYKRCPHLFSVVFDPILFILAGNKDMHKISDEFEFRPDQTTDYGAGCPWTSKKFPTNLSWENGVSILAHSFLIESSSKLLVTRTGIKARSSSILDRIRPLILELLALKWRKFHTFELEYLWSQLTNLDQIVCVSSLGWGKGWIRFWGKLGQNPGFHGNRKSPLTYNGENDVFTFLGCFWSDSFYTCR